MRFTSAICLATVTAAISLNSDNVLVELDSGLSKGEVAKVKAFAAKHHITGKGIKKVLANESKEEIEAHIASLLKRKIAEKKHASARAEFERTHNVTAKN